jgi:hypothetical protein
LPAEVLDQYRPGSTVVESAFTSTSRNLAGAGDLTSELADVELQIVSRGGGRDISEWSRVPADQEVLFPPVAEFQILARRVNSDTGRLVVCAMEVAR